MKKIKEIQPEGQVTPTERTRRQAIARLSTLADLSDHGIAFLPSLPIEPTYSFLTRCAASGVQVRHVRGGWQVWNSRKTVATA